MRELVLAASYANQAAVVRKAGVPFTAMWADKAYEGAVDEADAFVAAHERAEEKKAVADV